MADINDQDILSIKIEISDDNVHVLQKMSTEDIMILINTIDGDKKKFIDFLLNNTNIFKRDDSHKIFNMLDSQFKIDIIGHIAIHPNIKYSVEYIYEILKNYGDYEEKKYVFTIFQDNMKCYKKIVWIEKILLLFGEMSRESTLQMLIFMFGRYKGKVNKQFIEYICMLLDDEFYMNNMIHIARAFKYVDMDDVGCVNEIRSLLSSKITNMDTLHRIYNCLDINKKITLHYDEYNYDLSQMRIKDKLSFFKDNKKIVEIHREDFDKYLLVTHNGQIIQRYFSNDMFINNGVIIC